MSYRLEGGKFQFPSSGSRKFCRDGNILVTSKAVVFKMWSSDPWGSTRPFRVCEIKIIFIIMLKYSVPFSLSFFHELRVFSRDHIACADIIALMVTGMCACRVSHF